MVETEEEVEVDAEEEDTPCDGTTKKKYGKRAPKTMPYTTDNLVRGPGL